LLQSGGHDWLLITFVPLLPHADDLIIINDNDINVDAVWPMLSQVCAGQVLSLQSTLSKHFFVEKMHLIKSQKKDKGANIVMTSRSQPFL